MTSLNELIYSIFNTVRPSYNGTTPLSLELIKYHIINIRASLIKNDLNKGHSVDSYIVQNLGCLELETADKGCCDVPVGCYVLKTIQKIPSTIEMHNRQMITRVGPVDITSKPFQLIEYERVPFTGKNRFTKNLVKYFIKDGYIYLVINNDNPLYWGLTTINVQGVFEDPTEISSFNNCDGNNCYDDTKSFPVKSWMIPAIQELVIKKFIAPQNIAPVDNSSDSKPNLESQITQ